MAEKRVKVGKEFEHIPAVKSGRGWLGLEKGKTASVRFSKTYKKLQLIEKLENGKERRTLFAVEDYAKANEAARNANKIGEQAGAGFGALRKEEEAALKFWREYVFQKTQKDAPPRPLIDILREAIEREETKDETPRFSEVAFKFIEAKDAAGACSLAYRNRIKNYLERLSKEFAQKTLAEISEPLLIDAINKAARSRNGGIPAPKTRKHYLEITKELFKWWFTRENSTRRPNEKLNNPLEIVALPKLEKTKDPEILTVEQARAILADLWKNHREAVPAAVLQLFCGIREAEAMRLRWRDIIDDEIRLSCTITKTKIARSVPLPANARAWLDACRVEGLETPANGLIFPFNDLTEKDLAGLSDEARERKTTEQFNCRAQAYCYRIKRTSKRIGFKSPQNAFRHTAVSCLAVIHGYSLAADYCGHSKQIQGVNYRGLVSRQDAKDYFGIMPPAGDGKAIAFDRSRAKTGATEAASVKRGKSIVSNAPEAFPAKSAGA